MGSAFESTKERRHGRLNIKVEGLKPCPFCGGEARMAYLRITKALDENDLAVGIRCRECGVMTPKIAVIDCNTKEAIRQVKAVWHTRLESYEIIEKETGKND